MTQEEKDLLLKDLCARLPYEPMLKVVEHTNNTEADTVLQWKHLEYIKWSSHIDIKPYLRPISSMTEEEMDKLFDILHIDKQGKGRDWIKINDDAGIKFLLPTGRWIEDIDAALSYLRSIHIDIIGLIEKGLALEALEGMYKED